MSVVCLAQTKIEKPQNLIFSDAAKSEQATLSAVKNSLKAVQRLAASETIERLDSIVAETETGTISSREVYTYNNRHLLTSLRKDELIPFQDQSGYITNRFVVFEKQEFEYNDRDYVILDNKRVLLDPVTNRFAEGLQNRYVIDANGYIAEQYIDLYNTQTGDWDKATHTLNNWDETNPDRVFLEAIVSLWNAESGEYDVVAKVEITYDSRGSQEVRATYHRANETWVGDEIGKVEQRHVYFSEKDLIAVEKVYDWSAANREWTPLRSMYLTYNSLGNLESVRNYTYSSANDSTCTKRENLTYLDREGVSKDLYLESDIIEMYVPEKDAFVWAMKDVYNYRISNDTIYGAGTRTAHVIGYYIGDGDNVEFIFNPESTWREEERNIIYRDYVGSNEIYLKEEVLQDGQWTGHEFRYSYDDQNRITEWITYEYFSNRTTRPVSKVTSTYYQDTEKVAESKSYSYQAGEWVYESGHESEYDEAGFKILTKSYVFDVFAGAAVGRGGERVTFDYAVPASEVVMPAEGLMYKLLTIEELSYYDGEWYTNKIYTAYYSSVEKENALSNIKQEGITAYITGNTLVVDSSVSETVEIYSVTGALVFSGQKAEGKAVFNIANLPAGAHIIKGANWQVKGIK